jgi:hypothetical protein
VNLACFVAATNFDGRTLTMATVAGNTASNLNWTLNVAEDLGRYERCTGGQTQNPDRRPDFTATLFNHSSVSVEVI